MARKPTARRREDIFTLPSPDSPEGQHYSFVTLRPWPSLVFILPMLVFFEVGIYYTHNGAPDDKPKLVAVYLIERVVTALGAGHFGYVFPGMAVVGHSARLAPGRPASMAVRPVCAARHARRKPDVDGSAVRLQPCGAHGPAGGHTASASRMGRRGGAWRRGGGSTRKLVFRLVLITFFDILLVNVFKANRSASLVFAVLASSALFAAQHHPPLGAESFELTTFIFRTAAGVYLAGLFLYRGFGIAGRLPRVLQWYCGHCRHVARLTCGESRSRESSQRRIGCGGR